MTEQNEQKLEGQILTPQEDVGTRIPESVEKGQQEEPETAEPVQESVLEDENMEGGPETMDVPEVSEYMTPELAQKVQPFFDMAFSSSPEKASEKAKETNDPEIIDALHDLLSRPDIYKRLVDLGKISPPA